MVEANDLDSCFSLTYVDATAPAPTLTGGTVIKFDANGEYAFTHNSSTYKFKLSSDGKSIDLYNADTNEKLGSISNLPDNFAGTVYVSYSVENDNYTFTPNVIYSSDFDTTALHIGDVLAPGAKDPTDHYYYRFFADGMFDNVYNTAIEVKSDGLYTSMEGVTEKEISFDGVTSNACVVKDVSIDTCTVFKLAPTYIDTLSVTTAPTPATGLKYTVENGAPKAQELLDTPGTASDGATMQYAVYNGGIFKNTEDSRLELTEADVKDGNIYTAVDDYGVMLPAGYKVNYNNTLYKSTSGDARGIDVLRFEGEGVKIGDSSRTYALTDGANALIVTSVDTDGKVIYVKGVNTDSLADTLDLTWSATEPTATDVGNYLVFYKAVKDSLESAVGSVKATIAKGELKAGTDYTAPTIKDELYYTGEDQDLITAGEITADKGTMKYAVGDIVIDTDERALTVDDLVIGTVFKPTTTEGFTFPDGYTYKTASNYDYPREGKIYYANGRVYIAGGSGVLTSDYDALRIVDIQDKVIIYNAVNTNSLVPSENAIWTTTIPQKKDLGEYTVYYKIDGGDNYNDVPATNIGTAKIEAKIVSVTLKDLVDAKIADADGKEVTPKTDTDETNKLPVYSLQAGKTYTLYTNSTVANADSETDIAELTGKNKIFDNTSYAYQYEVTIPQIPADTYELYHEHAVAAHSNKNGDGVYVECSGEANMTADVAKFSDNVSKTYYYGSCPTAADIVTTEQMGATAKVTDFYFSAEGSTASLSEDDLTIGKTYVINARVAVTLPDKENADYFYIKRTFTYEARPMTSNIYTLEINGDSVPLKVDDSGAITVPEKYYVSTDGENKYVGTEKPLGGFDFEEKDTFTFTGKEQAPVIKVANGGKETLVLTAADAEGKGDYTDSIKAQTNAGSYTAELTAAANGNYTDKVTLKWSIAKAKADITIAPKDNIVYDGAKLTKDDFTFTGKDAALMDDAKTTVSVSGTDIKNAGERKATVKLTFQNYADITKELDVTIKKRNVTVTPSDKQSIIYGTEEAPKIRYTTEKAYDTDKDGEWDILTGFIPTDNELDFSKAITIAGFDYEYFVNDAGSYDYEITDAVFDNYTVVLGGTAVFKVEPKELTKEMFTLDEANYTFDGTVKKAPGYVIGDGNFTGSSKKKLTDNDFDEGGTEMAVLPGTYTLEFNGKNNYKGLVTFEWQIKPIEEYSTSLTVTDKTYDGTPIEPESHICKTQDNTKTDIPGAKTEYTYYEYDGKSTVNEAYVKTLTALEGAPKDAGSYIVEAATTARGYSFAKVYKTFKINKKQITVTPNTVKKTYGDPDPDFTDYTYDKTAVIEGETVNITGKYGLKDYKGNAGTYEFTVGSLKTDNNNYELTLAGSFTVERQNLTDESIKIVKKCVQLDDGWAYPGDCIKVRAISQQRIKNVERLRKRLKVGRSKLSEKTFNTRGRTKPKTWSGDQTPSAR